MVHPSTRKISALLTLLTLLMVGCESRQPFVGVILIDTDLPTLYRGELPIGVTLDPGSGGKDLLSNNLLLNGGWELASHLEGCGYDRATGEVVTPNGSRLPYPLPEQHFGWELIGQNIGISGDKSQHYLLAHVSSTDSLVGIRQNLRGVEISPGESYRLTLTAQSTRPSTIIATLVDAEMKQLSTPLTLPPTTEGGRLVGQLKVTQADATPSLFLEIKATEGEPYLVQRDSISYWTSQSSATVTIDDLLLQKVGYKEQYGLDENLYALLSELHPSFVRFPAGATANGLYPGNYPLYLDSIQLMAPLWTLNQNEYTHHFGYPQLLQLAHALHSTPIIVANFGFSDPSTIQRIEDIKLLPQRIDYIEQLIAKAPQHQVAVQPGYGLGGAEYDRRLTQLLDKLDTIYPNLQLISAADRSPYKEYSDYPFDLVLPLISYNNLAHIDSLITQRDQLLYPQMMSEATFDTDYTKGYFLPPLALRAAFMILAERRTPYLQALGLTPLIATDLEEQFPIIEAKSGTFHPTLFYQYLCDFTQLRGENLCRWDSNNSLQSDVITSLTADKEKKTYYLKAVNVTRHPLHYQIKLKGKNSNFTSVEILSYTSTEPTTSLTPAGFAHYEKSVTQERLRLSSHFHYLFAPYEVVIFKFS